ncbi:MAG: hypothetical protein AB7F40_11470 [Victivallaceae bacterium]|nr:hypothetical protein [Victivallaceae bacterium]
MMLDLSMVFGFSVIGFILCALLYLIFSMIKPSWNDFMQLAIIVTIFPFAYCPEFGLHYAIVAIAGLSCINIVRYFRYRKAWTRFVKIKECIRLVTPVGASLCGMMIYFIADVWASC